MNVQKQLRKVINASGRMSILGVSTMDDSVMKAMEDGAKNFYVMEELHDVAGKIAAAYMQMETAFLTNSASAGIALSVAGMITKEQMHPIQHGDLTLFSKREILLMKGHHVDYGAPVGTMIALGGGIVKEAGYANGCTLEQIASAATENTAAILYVKSHHAVQKNMPNLKEVSRLAKELALPVIVDIAAEEEFTGYNEYADVIILSGSKALEGPTSGIIAGKEWAIQAIRAHQYGIGRAMKIGKEAIFGLLQAFENDGISKMSKAEQMDILTPLLELGNLPGVKVSMQQDEAGREIVRLMLQIDEEIAPLHAEELAAALKAGNPAIFTRDYFANIGILHIDPRSVHEKEVEIILSTMQTLLSNSANGREN